MRIVGTRLFTERRLAGIVGGMRSCWLLGVALVWAARGLVSEGLAGGSGLNVIVVINQRSSNSVALGNYYCEMRQVPPQNVFRMSNWAGGNVSWSLQDFTNHLLAPLHSAIISRKLTNQADFVLLSMDIPYRIEQGVSSNSTTSALFYGFKTNGPPPQPNLPNGCSLPTTSSNSFAGSELPFRVMFPSLTKWTNLMASMITASNLSWAKLAVSQGVLGDSTFPSAPAYLVKSPSDIARNIRYQTADNAVFDARVQGLRELVRTNRDGGPPPVASMSGAQTGWQNYSPFGITYAPGTFLDNLTSIGGKLFEVNDHLRLIEMLRAGVSGAYGAVDEPCAYLAKFPTPHLFFYQSRGFSLAECFYMGVTNPYQGLLMGDPLSATHALPPTASWTSVPTGALSGAATFSLQAAPSASNSRISRVDLYLDGVWFQTLTNISPARYNTITVTIAGKATSYIVPLNATTHSVASGLVSALNGNKAQTKTAAVAHGDRIDLKYEDQSVSGSVVLTSVQTAQGSASALTTLCVMARTNFLDSIAWGTRKYEVTGNPANRWLSLAITKKDGTPVSVGATNTTTLTLGGLCQALATAVNSHPLLTSGDGLVAEDLIDYGSLVNFNLRARTSGWAAAGILVDGSAATGVTITPWTQNALNQNLGDLQPRNHLQIASGVANLPITFQISTTQIPNGHHELTAVIMEGSSVQTQRRISTNIIVQNGTLTGSLTSLVGGANAALEATLRFQVAGSGATISKVELFSTGGVLGSSATSSATFDVPGEYLGPGLHPVYGMITASEGQQYRAETLWMRVLDYEPAFDLIVSGSPPHLEWPATAGRAYSILGTTNFATPFQPVASVVPTNTLGQWVATNSSSLRQFYRVRSGT